MERYAFADPSQWSDDRLERRKTDLNKSGEVPQSITRAYMIAREGLHIIYEQTCREQDAIRIAS